MQHRAAQGEWLMQTAAKSLNKDNSVQKHNSGKKNASLHPKGDVNV